MNSGKIKEAYLYAKKLEKRNLDIYESDLIIGIFHFKNKKYDVAKKYFLKLKNRDSNFYLNNLFNFTFKLV